MLIKAIPLMLVSVKRAACAWTIIPLLLGSCTHSRMVPPPLGPVHGSESSVQKAASLEQSLIALSPSVRPSEARLLAKEAVRVSQDRRQQWRVSGPALFHNVLVNTKIKPRGLCYQWAEDLFLALYPLRMETLELHWAESRVGTWREHNCVVVTARGQAFTEGTILDAWRHAGRLFYGPVKGDRYPWVLGESASLRARFDVTHRGLSKKM